MAGAEVPIQPTPGVMVAFEGRLTERAVNRLNVPGDGDIAIPQRRMIVVGTTSFEIQDLDYIPLVDDQVAMMVERGSEMIPGLANCSIRGKYMSSRPLIKSGSSARSIARTFKCFDHQEADGIAGFVTITGGKATTCRAMAERTADVVCAQLGITEVCCTRDVPLASYRSYKY
jgi:glycerol-3-phosphate dehydrogenase